jgi:hypothetical protein
VSRKRQIERRHTPERSTVLRIVEMPAAMHRGKVVRDCEVGQVTLQGIRSAYKQIGETTDQRRWRSGSYHAVWYFTP